MPTFSVHRVGIQLVLNLFYFLSFQLDNADEQAAQVRRELDGRLNLVEQMARVSKLPILLNVLVTILK